MGTGSREGLDVALLCHGWFPDVGGIESHTRELARELRARGHRVRALCLDYGEELEPYSVRREDVEGVDVHRMAYLYHDHRALADVVENRRAEEVAGAWLAKRRPDVLHVQHVTGFGIGVLRTAREAGIPTVATLHDYWSLCPRGQMMRDDLTVCERPEPAACGACLRATWPHLMPSGGGEARGPDGRDVDDDEAAAAERTSFALKCLEHPRRLLTPSAAARDVYGRAGLAPERIEVCENGVETAHLAEEVARLRATRPRSDGEVRLGVLGSVLPSKGALELTLAFLEADVEGMALEIHGNLPSYHGDESYVDELQRLAEGNERVRLHGPYRFDRLAGILADLDGVAAPSRWVEVYGLTVREAAAAGLPVLVSDAGDLSAVANEGRAGLVVAVDDHTGWVDALRRFGTDAEARRRWSEGAPRLRATREMVDQIEGVYREVVREAGGEGTRPAARPGLLGRLFGRRR